jgi:hypothetical protein
MIKHAGPWAPEGCSDCETNGAWIVNNTPLKCRPPGDGPENYDYSAVAPPVEPEDDGVVPPLVLRARQMGLDV